MARRFGLGKHEKLKSRKRVDDLFATGKSVGVFPLRIYFKFLPASNEEEAGLQIGVTVSKKHFKKAVDRNRIKRLLREAYRLQKEDLVARVKGMGLKGFLFFIYVDKTKPDFKTVYETMAKCLSTLQKRAAQVNENPS